MFDFMKDMYFEVNGYDMEKIKEQKKEKIEREKRETFILNKRTKRIISIFLLLNLVVCVISFIVAIRIYDIGGIVKNVISIIASLITIFAFLFKGKSAEITGIMFMVLTFIVTFMFPIF